jgi:hypothetical protein
MDTNAYNIPTTNRIARAACLVVAHKLSTHREKVN